MVYQLCSPESKDKAAEMFAEKKNVIINACLEGTMGAVYADNPENPQSAMALLGDFCFFAGRPNRKLVQYKPQDCEQRFIIMVPQNAHWSALIEDVYGKKAKKIFRYATKKQTMDTFERGKLEKAVLSMENEYEICRIDESVFKLCLSQGWSRDLVSQFPDYEMYRKQGIGIAILKDGELVSGASSYASYSGGIEIEIDTKPIYRRKGLAYACGAKLILECLRRDLYPSWDAHNIGSLALAEKLGYQRDRSYPAYEIVNY